MSYLVLARKYRPQTFESVVGQKHVTQTLANAITSGRTAHAVLFSGPRGTGKTTIARILAKAMNCSTGPTPNPCNTCPSCVDITSGKAADVFEIDGASNNGVDQVRDLRENVKYMPQHSRYKIYIIDEVHMLSVAAFNALLKTLEEPPEHVLFFFATTEPQKIPVTILSRCQRHDLKRIGLDDIVNHMNFLCEKESIRIEQEGLTLIAREAGGCLRDALSLLDQVISFAREDITADHILDMLGIVDRKMLYDMSAAILGRNLPGMLEILDKIYTHGHDLKKFFAELIQHFRNMLVVKIGNAVDRLVDLPPHEIEHMRRQVADISHLFLTQMLDRLLKEETAVKWASQPKIALEMACIKLLEIQPALPVETLIEQIDLLRNALYSSGASPAAPSVPIQHTEEIESSAVAHEQAPAPDRTAEHRDDAHHPPQTASADSGEAARENPAADQQPAAKTGTAAAPDAAVAIDISNPSAVWRKLQTIITRKFPSLGGSLADSAITRLTEDTIELQIKTSTFNANLIQRKKSVLTEIIDGFFRKQMKVQLNAETSEDDQQPDRQPPGQVRNEALRDPLVKDAMEVFEGRIEDVKIL